MAAIAPVAGYCWTPDPRPVRPVPTLFIVGDADPLIPLQPGPVRLPWGNRVVDRPGVWDSLRTWAVAIGCRAEPVIVGEADGVTDWTYPGVADFRVVTVAGLGHHWPGGKGRLNPRIGGPPSDRLDGNERVSVFFRRSFQ